MKMRTGLIAGAAVGYYLGAKAGRERYEQMAKAVRLATRAGATRAGAAKLRAAADLGFERVRDILGNQGDDNPHIVSLESRAVGRSSRRDRGSQQPGTVVQLSQTRQAAQGERRYY